MVRGGFRLSADNEQMSLVVIRPCAGYSDEAAEAALQSVLAPLGGLDWVTPGMRVAVKANLISAMKPEAAATTHPVLLAALTRLLTARGAAVTVGDSPGGVYNRVYVEHVYEVCGLKALEAAGAALNRDYSIRELANPEGKVLKALTYTAWLDGADAIINFSKLKVHAMMGMTAATKNMFGVVPGSVKAEYHYRFPDYADFADMLVDLNQRFRPRLNLCDAVVGMEGNGPTQGTPKPIGALLASASPYELDLAAASLIGLTKETVPYLEAAYRRGLLPAGSADLELDGDLAAFRPDRFRLVAARDDLTQLVGGQSPVRKLVRAAAQRVLRASPALDPAKCVGCGVCVKACPAKAIALAHGKACIHRGACIRCFCCQELCPRGAMHVQRPLAARIAGRL